MYSLLLYGTLLDNLVFACAQLEKCSHVGLVVFFVYIALAALTVLNMLIGVLCEMVSMVAHQEKDRMLTRDAAEKLALVIKELDQDEDFKLSKKEFLDILVNPTAAQALADIGVDPIGVIEFADLIFSNEVGLEAELSFEEFMDVILQLRGTNSSTVRHMVELKHMIAQQLDDLVKGVQEHQMGMDMTNSFSPSGFALQPAEMLTRRRSSDDADFSLRDSADTFVVVESSQGSHEHPSEAGAGHARGAPEKLHTPPRMFTKVTSEQAPDLPPVMMEVASDGAGSRSPSPSPLLRAESLEGQGGSPASNGPNVLSRRSSVSSACPSDSDGNDVSEELSALQSRTERMEDTLAEVLAAVQKLSAQFAADSSPRGDPASDDEQAPQADTPPLSPLVGLPGVPVPATPLGR